jgi:hypothetical protein
MAATTMLLVLNILLLLCSRAAGFQSPASCRTAVCVQGTTSSEPTSSASEATKTLLSFGKAGLFAAALLSAQSASAKVFFDTDVYGDKELKIATVNKVHCLCGNMLCCVVRCYAVMSCAVVCCDELCSAVLCCAVLLC